MNRLLIIFLMLISSCASFNKGKPCEKWDLHCINKALEYEKTTETISKAAEIFEYGCENNHSYSCTQAGYHFANLKNISKAKEISLKGCQLADERGCFNLACYYCREQNIDDTKKYLELSFYLGGNSWSDRLKDPDLKCLKDTDLEKMSLWDSYASNNVNLSLNHTYFPAVRSSIEIPEGFIKTNDIPLIFYSSLGANLVIGFEPVMELKDNLNFLISGLDKKKILLEKKFIKNGFDTIFVKLTFQQGQQKLFRIISLIKTDQGNLIIQSTFPQENQYIFEAIMTTSIFSAFYNPLNIGPSFSINEIEKFTKLNLQYNGFYSTGYYFSKVKDFVQYKVYPNIRIIPMTKSVNENLDKETIKNIINIYPYKFKIKNFEKISSPDLKIEQIYKYDIESKEHKFKSKIFIRKPQDNNRIILIVYSYLNENDLNINELLNIIE